MGIELPFGESFATAWESWLEYRIEIKKPYKSEKSIKRALKYFEKYSEETAVKMIDQTIRNGWQGIFELKTKNGMVVGEKETYIPTSSHQLQEPRMLTPDSTGVLEHVRTQIELFYQTGEINDLGNIIYNYLENQGILKLSDARMEEISAPLKHEATRKRKRTEEPYLGSVNAEIKREYLRTFLTENKVEL